MAEAGMTSSKEDIVFLSRLICDYIKNTSEGKKTVFSLLNTTVRPADIKNHYQLSAKYQETREFNYKDLVYYVGWIYQGTRGVGAEDIEIEKNGNLEACEITGIMAPKDYCIKFVRDYNKDYLVPMSNFARLHSEHQYVRDTAKADVCAKCPVFSCPYHKTKTNESQLKLVSTSKGA